MMNCCRIWKLNGTLHHLIKSADKVYIIITISQFTDIRLAIILGEFVEYVDHNTNILNSIMSELR